VLFNQVKKEILSVRVCYASIPASLEQDHRV
jgi:hypothetical protein